MTLVIPSHEIPYSYEVTDVADALQRKYAHLIDGEESGVTVSVAGRMMLRREQGKLAFATLVDGSGFAGNGKIQLFALTNLTDRFEDFTKLNLGDWIGVEGQLVRTKRGELSVKVAQWTFLAQARRGFGDKFHGITDTDTRYRQRYADLWANEESRRVFLLRSRVLSFIRTWMQARGFVEVETPILVPVHGGAHARPFETHHNALDMNMTLRIAQELYLKRLVVGGIPRVFELGRVFRNEGLDTRHNPEFTMLEAQQAYGDYNDMMELFELLVSDVAAEVCGTTTINYQGRELDLSPPWRRATMPELVAEVIGLDVEVSMSVDKLRGVCDDEHLVYEDSWGPGRLVAEIYDRKVESQVWGPVHVFNHPREISPLARPHRSNPDLVERFEPTLAGRELGNNFTELIDPDEQRARLTEQSMELAAGDEEAMQLDEDYLRAMEYGLPPNAGLGLGVDRLVMLLADVASIRDVVLFPALRPEAPE